MSHQNAAAGSSRESHRAMRGSGLRPLKWRVLEVASVRGIQARSAAWRAGAGPWRGVVVCGKAAAACVYAASRHARTPQCAWAPVHVFTVARR